MIATASAVLPPLYDIVWSATGLIAFVLIVAALVSLTRRRHHLSSTASALWAVVIIFLVVVGPLAWFAIGRASAASHSPS